jgi:hypothetical protein
MHAIPNAMIEADGLKKWPSERRLPGSLLSGQAPFMSQMDFELLTLSQICGQERSMVADLETLVRFAKSPGTARGYQVYVGNNMQGPSDLPWLDVKSSLVIGGGADYGDDTFIALDYRLNPRDPRVVISQYNHYASEGARTAPSHISWLAIATNIQGFIALLTPTTVARHVTAPGGPPRRAF